LEPAAGVHNGVVQLSPGARALFDQWNADMQKLSTAFDVPRRTPYASHLRKLPGFAARIALTYHCTEVVSSTTPSTIPDPHCVRSAHRRWTLRSSS